MLYKALSQKLRGGDPKEVGYVPDFSSLIIKSGDQVRMRMTKARNRYARQKVEVGVALFRK
jgi:hypothetical protein